MQKNGYTLIELVMVIAIIAVILAIVIVPLSKFRKQEALQNTTNAITSILNEARTKTLAGYNNTTYSVRIESTRAILFVGTTYSSDASTNEIYTYESPTTATYSLQGGGQIISFVRLKGTTTQYGTITTSVTGVGTKTITVSSTGTIVRN